MITPFPAPRQSLILFLILFQVSFLAKAQQFSFSSSADNVTYQALSSQNLLNAVNQQWNFSYRLPIGFSWNYLGRSFDSLTVETNGYLVLDKDRNYAFTAFNQFGDCVDSSGNHSTLSYALSGTTGNHILKIQFGNISQSGQNGQKLSYQIWLKETGGMEVRIGPNDFQPIPGDSTSVPDTMQYVRIGAMNMNMDTNPRGYFIGGDRQQPVGSPLDDNHPDVVYLHGIPAPGTRYTFTPLNQ